MELDDYLRDREIEYCRSRARQGDDTEVGELACTEHRLIFVKGGAVTDIDLRSIEEIKYEPAPISWELVGLAILSLIIGGAVRSLQPVVPQISRDVATLTVVLGVIFAIGALAELYRRHTQTLTIRTSQSERKFRGGEFADFPHAIRGASW